MAYYWKRANTTHARKSIVWHCLHLDELRITDDSRLLIGLYSNQLTVKQTDSRPISLHTPQISSFRNSHMTPYIPHKKPNKISSAWHKYHSLLCATSHQILDAHLRCSSTRIVLDGRPWGTLGWAGAAPAPSGTTDARMLSESSHS